MYKQAADYTPAPGDIVFFNNDGNGRAGHVGIVKELFTQTDPQTGAETALLRTIEGNTSGMVREHEYTLTDSLLLGYGSLAAAYARAVELGLVEPVAYIVSDELQALLDQFSAEAAASEAASDEDLTAALDRMLALYSQAESLFLQLNADAQEGAFASWMAQQYPDAYATYSSLLENSALINPEEIAERAVGTNWITLRDSGYFEYWSNTSEESRPAALKTARSRSSLSASAQSTGDPSDVQIREEGGSAASDDGAVTVSKTIDGTDIENVFDITLQVQTQTNISEFYEELDMAVVIVMDISNTMKENFSGTTTRYAAAMEAAENFIDQFTASSAGVSKIGYVAFNTDAYEIFGLQNCSTETKAVSLKNTMRTKTGNIINATGYGKSHTRFTNIEAGLKMAQDMLAKAGNRNKYIIFLSDGFPTTYVMNGYTGYDPYMDSNNRNGITSVPGDKIGKDGYFYDKVSKKPCTYGTSYSDKAAIRARSMATAIKNAGIKIFSIGVDIGSQTIQDYINAQGTSFSVVDRTSGTYEIGSANSRTAYVNWLKGSGTSNTVGIGSGYYYDSTSHQELTNAYQQIFAEIQRLRKESSQIVWVSEDPLPISENNHETVEFIGFYNQQNVLTPGQLTGSNTLNGENTAAFTGQNIIRWDLKQSGYTSTSSGSTTVYTYTLVYRVRLKNEDAAFAERGYYPTNDRTTLQYQTLESINEVVSISDPKTIDFPIPAVEGYLSAFSFKKLDNFGRPVAGAEFTLTHDVQNCNRCRGDETSVSIQSFVAYSDADGTVSFANIPSGHQYTLTETVVPTGYQPSGESYQVTVDYDSISLTVMHADGATSTWVMDGTDMIVNATGYELPATGGSGTLLYTIGGLLLVAVPLVYGCSRRRKRERGPV